MLNFIKRLFPKKPGGTKIFEIAGTPMPDFKIIATHVRVNKKGKNYFLDDGNKLKSIVEKWRFEPGGSVGRCGYDYQMVLTNGNTEIPVSICFLCNTLILNHIGVYRISKRQILALLEEDFTGL